MSETDLKADNHLGWRRTALVALGAWGLIHLVGGLSLAVQALVDGPHPALGTLATAATPDELSAAPGSVVQGVLAFHGADIAAAGLVVLWIAAVTARHRWPVGVGPALLVVAVLDAGLVAFLVGPGYTAWGDGIWGPLLLALALGASLRAGWRPGGTSS